MLWFRLLLLLSAVLPLLPVLASEEDNALRAEVQRLRKEEPEVYARRRQELAWLLTFPPERREAMLKLQRELQGLRPSHRAHLLEVGRRYQEWLDQLPDVERQQIDREDSQERLTQVRRVREQRWLATLPPTRQKELATLKGAARVEEVERLQRAERWWQRQWQACIHHWDHLKHDNREPKDGRSLPARLEDFDKDVQTHVNEYLKYVLLPQEKEQLENAQGQWPLYPCTLVDLADKYPPALDHKNGPKHFNELPAQVRTLLQRKDTKPKVALNLLKKKEGEWPRYGIAVTTLTRQFGLSLTNELWPVGEVDLSRPMREFLLLKLQPVLDKDELRRLNQATGAWPDFPRTIQELARKHYLHPPWQTLPGLPDRWDAYRVPGNKVTRFG